MEPSRIALNVWQASGIEFAFRGHPVFCQLGGPDDGEVLVLVHGFPTASWDWEALWPALTKHYRVIALDMMGFGFSAKPRDYDYSIGAQADLFEAFLQREGVTHYHVLAHDYGDTVAQELLARQVEEGERPRLASVCLLNGGLFPETHRPLLTQTLLASPLGFIVAKLMSKPRFCRAMARIFGARTQPASDLLDGFWRLVEQNEGRAVMPQLIGYMAERRRLRERWVGALQTTEVPLKLVAGLADPISGAHMVARFRNQVPMAEVEGLEGIGHYPQCEDPASVLAAYKSFRASLRAH